jgi:RNA polymerase sigma factor (sigma-70 family)
MKSALAVAFDSFEDSEPPSLERSSERQTRAGKPVGAGFKRAQEPDRPTREAYFRGEPAAFSKLAGAWVENILRYASTVLGDEELAYEAAQETFAAFMESHRNYDPERELLPWLFGICRRCCRARVREESRHAARVIDAATALPGCSEDEEGSLPGPAAGARATTPFEALLRQEEGELVAKALARVAEPERAAVYLHIFEELTFREIGEALGGLATSTVSTRYYKGLESLRALLENELGRADSAPDENRRKGGKTRVP